MYPNLLMFEPTTAANLIMYRYNRMAQAALKAQSKDIV